MEAKEVNFLTFQRNDMIFPFTNKKAKIYKDINVNINKMIPSDPLGLLDESFFNSINIFKMKGFN